MTASLPDVPKTAFQMSGAMSAAVGGGGVVMVALVLFMIAVRQRCTKRKLRSAGPSSQPASPDKLREKDDSESDDRNPDIIPSDTDHLQVNLSQENPVRFRIPFQDGQYINYTSLAVGLNVTLKTLRTRLVSVGVA